MKKISKAMKRNFEIDWKRFPSVVFESDDWGACEVFPSQEKAEKIKTLFKKHGKTGFGQYSSLEKINEMENLYQVLEGHEGPDGINPVFTGFVCMTNPDYKAIREKSFKTYKYKSIDKGMPPAWERGDVVGKLQEGYSRGIFVPEYHGMLHHTSWKVWMEQLNSKGPEGELAHKLFDMECYYQGEHVPEYEGLNVREQHVYTQVGMKIFKNIFGFLPNAAVTSDAYPQTETVWSISGIKTVCLKNCRLDGEILTYQTKLWNNQDESVQIGEYDPVNDVVYMTRNVFFEMDAEPVSTFEQIRECRDKYNEPAIVSSHRDNYTNICPKNVQKNLRDLNELLTLLDKDKFYFLSTAEVSDLYRNGWSKRYSPKMGWIIRKWHKDATVGITPDGQSIESLNVGTHIMKTTSPVNH